MAVPTTLRIALLAGLLALLSNLGVIGFIYFRTHDDAVLTVRQQVNEQAKVLADVYRTGGRPALDDAVEDTITYGDPQTVIAIIEPDGRKPMGNLETRPASFLPRQEGYHNILVRVKGQPTPRPAAMFLHRLPTGEWLASGRIAGEGYAIRDTLERSMFIAVVVAVLLGLLCGVV